MLPPIQYRQNQFIIRYKQFNTTMTMSLCAPLKSGYHILEAIRTFQHNSTSLYKFDCPALLLKAYKPSCPLKQHKKVLIQQHMDAFKLSFSFWIRINYISIKNGQKKKNQLTIIVEINTCTLNQSAVEKRKHT